MKLTVNVEVDRETMLTLLEKTADEICQLSYAPRTTYAKFVNDNEINIDAIQSKLAEYNYYLSKIIDIDNAHKQLEGMSQEDILGEIDKGMDSSPTE